jgi:hypothetical protein
MAPRIITSLAYHAIEMIHEEDYSIDVSPKEFLNKFIKDYDNNFNEALSSLLCEVADDWCDEEHEKSLIDIYKKCFMFKYNKKVDINPEWNYYELKNKCVCLMLGCIDIKIFINAFKRYKTDYKKKAPISI